jgi:hypothetical protein
MRTRRAHLEIVGPSWRRLGSRVVETIARALIDRSYGGVRRELTRVPGEGPLSDWL